MWFQHDHDIDEKPEFLRIKRASGLDKLTVRGALSAWFEAVNKHGEFLLDGSNRGIMRGYSLEDLGDLIGLNRDFWAIVANEGWIEETSDGLIVPKFAERFGKLATKQKRGTEPAQPKRPRGRPRKNPNVETTPATPQDLGDPGTSDRLLPARELADDADRRIPDSQPNDCRPEDARKAEDSGVVRDLLLARPEGIPTADVDDRRETAGEITPQRPTPTQQASQFDSLSVEDLTTCGRLLAWMDQCALQPRPLVINDEFHRVRVIAAGIRATGKGVHTPLALFKSIVGKRRWTMLESDDIQRAKLKLATYAQLQTNRASEYRTRASPQAAPIRAAPVRASPEITVAPILGLVSAGFGAVPQEAPLTREQQIALARQWDKQRSKTG